MKIGLYFGSFNPIHNGHLILANHIAHLQIVKEVWFVVSPQNPLKKNNDLLNDRLRLHLVREATADNRKFKVSDIEFSLPKPSYTIETILYLQEKFPTYQFDIIIGSDSFSNLEKWKNYQTLIKLVNFIVYPRAGFPISNNIHATFIEIKNVPTIHISASFIREQIKLKKSIKYLLPPLIEELILNNNYYA